MGAPEKECQISQNYILHIKFLDFHILELRILPV